MLSERFDYELPDSAIAQVPVEPRDSARLLVDRGADTDPAHHTVAELAALLEPGDLLVVNDSRVLKARLSVVRSTGGAGEVLLLERGDDGWWEALVRPSAKTKPGSVVDVVRGSESEPGKPGKPDQLAAARPSPKRGPTLSVEVGEELGDGRRRVRLLVPRSTSTSTATATARSTSTSTASGSDTSGASTPVNGAENELVPTGIERELELLEALGAPPLPPYLTEGIADAERYQTVYAERPVSAAAPTAGLHLTPAVFDSLAARGVKMARVELAVGLDTFRPLRGDTLDGHVMHTESYRVPEETVAAIEAAARVVAVGTTVVRTLESWAATGKRQGRTDLFLRPGAEFRVVDVLLTNFHFPRSTLLVLLEAFMGPRWRALYDHALENDFRFLSLGDAMLVQRTTSPPN